MTFRFDAVPVKVPVFSTEVERSPNISLEPQETLKNKDRGITLLDFKLYYKAIVIRLGGWS